MPRLISHRGRVVVYSWLTIFILLLVSAAVLAQGNGRETTGTNGIHSIQGYIFFPSGRRAEGQIVVKLQSYSSGELTVVPDSSGEFTFTNLAPGNYPVVVNGGDNYELGGGTVSFATTLT